MHRYLNNYIIQTTIYSVVNFYERQNKMSIELYFTFQLFQYAKLSKKEAKRLKQEQTTFGESKALEAVTGVVEVQALLGNMTEEVRPDFLAGTNGACLLSEEELGKLDEIYAIVNPAEELSGKLSEQVDKCSSNLKMLLDGKDKEAFEGATCIFSLPLL